MVLFWRFNQLKLGGFPHHFFQKNTGYCVFRLCIKKIIHALFYQLWGNIRAKIKYYYGLKKLED